MQCLCYISTWLSLAIYHKLINHARKVLSILLFATGGGAQSQKSIAIKEIVNVLAIQIIIHCQIMCQCVLILRNQEYSQIKLATINCESSRLGMIFLIWLIRTFIIWRLVEVQ